MQRCVALTIAGWAGLCLLAAGGCGGGAGTGKGGAPSGVSRLNGAGSSFVKPMMDDWAKAYLAEKGIEVNYQSKGSSTGIEQATNKEIDFGCSDAPLNELQLKSAQQKGGAVLHIPLVMGAVVPVYNLAGVDKPLNFSGPVLADIFRRKIKKWNEEPLKELNPGVMLPDHDIKVVHRADGSGTNYIFTEFLSKVSPEWEKEIKFGTSVKWPAGTVGERGSEGVSKAVKDTPWAISYVELLYAMKIKMGYGNVAPLRRDKDGKPVNGPFIHADLNSVTAAAKSNLKEIPEDLRFSLTNAPGDDAYPISGTVWAICYVNQPPDRAQTITDFLRWITHKGQDRAAALHYARLPPELVERIDKKLGEIKAAR
jgi:phosphate transport system substrate-binding protein